MPTQGNKELADSLVFALRNLADFVELAKKFSIDKTSNKMEVNWQPFGINSYDKAFEDASFAIWKRWRYFRSGIYKSRMAHYQEGQ